MLNQRKLKNAVIMPFFRRYATTAKSYPPKPCIKHYIVSRDENSTQGSIVNEVNNVIRKSPDSIIFLTHRSRVIVTERLDKENPGRAATLDELLGEIKKITIKSVRQNENFTALFRPEPGHVCLTLTNGGGVVEKDRTVSLRPNRKIPAIAKGDADLYKNFYGEFKAFLFEGLNTTFEDEVKKLAGIVAKQSSTTVADITVVPFSSSKLSRVQVEGNISMAQSTTIYNLCKTIFKENALRNHDDLTVADCLEKLKAASKALDFDQQPFTQEDEVILAALACTSVAVESCFGDPHYLAKNIGLDLSTQSVVTLSCAMSIIGEPGFFDFMKRIGFYDKTIELIEGIDSTKIQPI
jgi:hypothetical protein